MRYEELNSMQKDELLSYYYWTDETPEFDCLDDVDEDDVKNWFDNVLQGDFKFIWEDY